MGVHKVEQKKLPEKITSIKENRCVTQFSINIFINKYKNEEFITPTWKRETWEINSLKNSLGAKNKKVQNGGSYSKDQEARIVHYVVLEKIMNFDDGEFAARTEGKGKGVWRPFL